MRGAIPLITTDGFKFYERVIGRVLAESDDPTRLIGTVNLASLE